MASAVTRGRGSNVGHYEFGTSCLIWYNGKIRALTLEVVLALIFTAFGPKFFHGHSLAHFNLCLLSRSRLLLCLRWLIAAR